MKRAALYARVSTSDGRQDPLNQLAELRAYAAGRHVQIACEYVDFESGARSDRKALVRMLADAARRKFDVVMVWNLDRLSREGVYRTFGYIQRLKASGVEFVSITEEHFRTTGPAGDLLMAVSAWIAEQERAKRVARVHAGLAKARSQGKKFGRPAVRAPGNELYGLQMAPNPARSLSDMAELTGYSRSTINRRIKDFIKSSTVTERRKAIGNFRNGGDQKEWLRLFKRFRRSKPRARSAPASSLRAY